MSGDDRAYAAFERRVDDAWMRERVRRMTAGPEDAAELAAALAAADPLGSPPPAPSAARRWRTALAELFQPWPARLALGAGFALVLLLGAFAGRALLPGPAAPVWTGTLPMPAYDPDRTTRALAGAGNVRPESQAKLRAAMAFHPQPDFAARALPLLEEAVALDAQNEPAHFWLGVALLHRDRPADAVPPLERAVKLAPADETYKLYLAMAYLRTGAVRRGGEVLGELLRRRR
ncbi:MAG TPA: tetratricopeptide repeat protein [Terriglobales bacterium]|nr:tetratricopeptide repeat protein [Terriglobales bacterium]